MSKCRWCPLNLAEYEKPMHARFLPDVCAPCEKIWIETAQRSVGGFIACEWKAAGYDEKWVARMAGSHADAFMDMLAPRREATDESHG